MYNSLTCKQCRDCFMKFTNKSEKRSGCKGLIEVPKEGETCGFHKTKAEQEASLMRAAKRNGFVNQTRMRIRDLRIF